jgi:glutathione synthase/RimK-type ligase-like ATP-grasp enzyme
VYAHPKIRSFAAGEARHAIMGALCAVTSRFLNSPYRSRYAALKPVQLAAARSVGLRTPRTLVTNSADAVRDVEGRWGGALVYKTLEGAEFEFFETRILSSDDQKDLHRIEGCPVIFQEHIEGDFDVRVTVVGARCYSARIDFHGGRHPVDSRIDPVATVAHELEVAVENKILNLMRVLGLNYAAIDMRSSRGLGYTFFELNPEGQYLWIERHTGHKISDATAEFLLHSCVKPETLSP